MAILDRAVSKALVLAGLMLAGCSGESTDGIFTGSLSNGNNGQVTAAPELKVDPGCVTLVSRIDTLRREGIGDKIEKAAGKRYRMTQADLSKADQLTKANAEFQLRCSTITPGNNAALVPAAQPKIVASKAPPPVSASSSP